MQESNFSMEQNASRPKSQDSEAADENERLRGSAPNAEANAGG